MESDAKIYRKARRHVIGRLLLFFIFLSACVIGTDMLLNLDFLRMSSTNVHEIFMLSSLVEILVYLLLFLGLAFGKGWVRWLYWLVYIADVAMFTLPVKCLLDDWNHLFLYAAWMFCMFLKLSILLQIGLYFHRNKYAKIYYDHVLQVDEDEYDARLAAHSASQAQTVSAGRIYTDEHGNQYILQPVSRQMVPAQSGSEPVEDEDEQPPVPLTWPQVSLRLGAVIYGELVLFPMGVQFFQDQFMSMDMQSVFATRDMFILCIFSAFVWTVPVFFLYYSQKGARRSIWAAIFAEVLVSLWLAGTLHGYWQTDKYALRVFILFVAVDVVRYLILLWGVWPVLSGQAIRGEPEKIDLDDIEL